VKYDEKLSREGYANKSTGYDSMWTAKAARVSPKLYALQQYVM